MNATSYYRRMLWLLPAGLMFSTPSPGDSPTPVGWHKHVIVDKADGAINSAAAADFDHDGQIDVIASFDGKVMLMKGPHWDRTVVHHFQPSPSRNRPRSACIHSCLLDVDGDGDQDFCGSNNTVFWLECPDDPFAGHRWTYRTIDDEILGTHCLITGDVNRDGRLDLIANSGRGPDQTKFAHSLTWLEIPPQPHRADHWIRHVFAEGTAPGGSHYFGFGDVNGDRRSDIACAAKGGPGFEGGRWFAWWEQPADATEPWTKHVLAADQPGASNIHPVDVNSDGQMDFVATRGHAKGILWFEGPEFKLHDIDTTIDGPHCLVTVDLDNDGDVDAATVGRENSGIAKWYENDGKGNFQDHLIGTEQGSYDLRAVDMDSDRDLDLLVAGHGSGNIVWYENRLPTSRQ